MISLREALDSVRAELTELNQRSADHDLSFVVEDVELEFEIQAASTGKANIGGNVKSGPLFGWFLSGSISGEGELSKTDQTSHRIRLKMSVTTDRAASAATGNVTLSGMEKM